MDSQWLKIQLLANPEKTKAGLAAAIGLEPPAVSKILNGTRQIKAQEYIQMREYFGLPNDGAASTSRHYSALRVKPLDDADGFGDGKTPPSDWAIPGQITGSRTQPEKIRIFEVQDSFMEPDFRKGDHVLVDTADRKIEIPGVFIITDGYTNLLRHCECSPKSSDGEIRISARQHGFHAQILKRGDFILIGRVMAKLQML